MIQIEFLRLTMINLFRTKSLLILVLHALPKLLSLTLRRLSAINENHFNYTTLMKVFIYDKLVWHEKSSDSCFTCVT